MFCKVEGLSEEVWRQCVKGDECEVFEGVFTCGMVLELNDWCVNEEVGVKGLCVGIGKLLNVSLDVSNLRSSVKRMNDKRRKLRKRKDGCELDESFLNERFGIAGGASVSESETENVQVNVDMNEVDVGKNDECTVLRESLCEVSKERDMLVSRLDELERKYCKLEEKYDSKVNECRYGLNAMKKKVQRRESEFEGMNLSIIENERMIESLKKEVDSNEVEILDGYVCCEEVSDKYEDMRGKYMNAKKSMWYAGRKNVSLNVDKKVRSLNERVKVLENENVTLREKLNEFLDCTEIKCFANGKYVSDIRGVYQELVGMGVSAGKVQEIVRSVLEGLGKSVDRLPGATLAKMMAYECRSLAWMQLNEVMNESENVTLMSDGTSKYGHHYGAFDVRTSDGDVYMLGMRDVASGDSESTLKLLLDVLGDVASVSKGELHETVDKMLVNVKNTMSDRAAAERKFGELLHEYRKKVVPSVVSGWGDMSGEERMNVERMNNFFCGMHFLVALAEQADVSMKMYERLIFGEDEVGARSFMAGKSGVNESGAVRLVRTVYKAVQDRGCERAGKPVQFRGFLKIEHGIEEVPLAPFKGNRFNIAFHNGAGVYGLYPMLKDFFECMKDENQLMKAVYEDLNVVQFAAGVRALGLIDKIVTGPLWRVLERNEHVSCMNEKYERMLECFSLWSEDAGDVVKGSVCMFEDVEVKRDWVYDALVHECELDGMTRQILELIFTSFASKTRKMLREHLSGGEHASMDVAKMCETESVPKTNVSVERDFGLLDFMVRMRPSAYTCTIEGVLMYRKNGTKEWLNGLGEERVNEVMECARKSVRVQRNEYVKRKAVVGALRAECVQMKKEANERKSMQERVRAEELSGELGLNGG